MSNLKRTFIPGDQWVYFKIYCGYRTADEILISKISALVEYYFDHNIIDKWFFIRYIDPDFHLRIRFHVKEIKNIGFIIQSIKNELQAYIDSGMVWKIMLDTYQREIERYSLVEMENSEYLFSYDSNTCLNIIKKVVRNSNEELRWLLCLKSIDSYLNDLGLDLRQKLSLIEIAKNGYEEEFNIDKSLKKQLSQKYRNEKNKISDFLDNNFTDFVERSTMNRELFKNMFIKWTTNEVYNHTLSVVHMICNRIFKSKQRLHELVVYNFLYNYYKTKNILKKENTFKKEVC